MKAKTRKEVASEYEIDRTTFYRWLKAAGIILSQSLITPKELKLIYRTFGKPLRAN